MKQLIVSLLFVCFSFGAGAQVRCQEMHNQRNAGQLLETLNEKYSDILFQESFTENIERSFFPARKYKLFKLRRMLKDLNKNHANFDSYDLYNFVYRLDRLAFAEMAADNKVLGEKLSSKDKQILSETRRSLLMDGIAKNFEITDQKSGFWKKFRYYFGQSISWKYWRWTQSAIVMPKLVGLTLPAKLAEKIAWEGLEAHRAEVEKYIPAIRTRAGFNKFSKVYNWLLVTSLFTVVPYMANDFYKEQVRIGDENATLMLAPLVETTKQMSEIDFNVERENGILEKYKVSFTQTHQREPTEPEVLAAQALIHAKLTME